MTVCKDAVFDYIEDHRIELIKFLQNLVRQESVTGNEKPAQEIIIKKFESLGLNADVWEPDPETLHGHPGYFETSSFQEHGYTGRPNVAAVVQGGEGRSLAFSGHIDVVSPDPVEDWTYGPWNPVVKDGKLFGRGSGDMKGGIAAFVYAAQAILELDIKLRGNLILQSTIEEEDGGVGGVLSALERGYQPDAAIIPEPYHIPNIAIASAGVMYFRVTVYGKTAIAARGYQGESAIMKAIQICDALDKLDQERKRRIAYEPAVRLDPKAEGNVTNINVGTFEGGNWPSTVPGKATIEVRVGWPPGESREDVREEICTTIQNVAKEDEWLRENPPEIVWFGWDAEPHELDPSEEIVQIAKKNCETIMGEPTSFIGGTAALDERYYNAYYDIPCPSVGPKGYSPHGVDECVDIDSLVDTAKILATTAIDWCGISD